MNIFEGSIPHIWEAVVKKLLASPRGELPCVIMSSSEDLNTDTNNLQPDNQLLDPLLLSLGNVATRTVANTIFPRSLWNPELPRDRLFSRYERIWPKIKSDRANRNGVYFRRLTHYPPKSENAINQLDRIIDYYLRGTHRRSMCQLLVYDPLSDLDRSPQRGFPCLQHVSATVTDSQLTVTGTYVMQHAIPKLYGNLLGLRNLGTFISHELGIRLDKTVCIAHHEKLGVSKRIARSLFPDE